MMILVKSCYSPSLGGELMLTLGSLYHLTPHKANISRKGQEIVHIIVPISLPSLVGQKIAMVELWVTQMYGGLGSTM